MSLKIWEPLDDLNRYFDDTTLFRPISLSGFWKGGDMAVDLYEKDGNLVAKTSIPGIDIKDLNISIENRNLTISGKRNEEKEEKGKDYYSRQIKRGSFSHSINLPKFVDSDDVKAEYVDGILSVTMPIHKGQEKKTIKIESKNGNGNGNIKEEKGERKEEKKKGEKED